MPGLHVRRLGYALGAEVRGLDLRAPLTEAQIAELRALWLEHLLLCFPEQRLDPVQLRAFAEGFGTIAPASMPTNPDKPETTFVTSKPVNGKAWDGYKNGHNWHSDQSYTTLPTTGTFLCAKELPPVGSDTMFANMYMAYEALSPGMQALVENLEIVHGREMASRGAFAAPAIVERIMQLEREICTGNPSAAHRAVRVHPETGRKALFLGGARANRFEGMTEEESRALLDFLTPHTVRYEFVYRHRWSVGDAVMWDNRCTLHVALCDYDLARDARHMARCSLHEGEVGRKV